MIESRCRAALFLLLVQMTRAASDRDYHYTGDHNSNTDYNMIPSHHVNPYDVMLESGHFLRQDSLEDIIDNFDPNSYQDLLDLPFALEGSGTQELFETSLEPSDSTLSQRSIQRYMCHAAPSSSRALPETVFDEESEEYMHLLESSTQQLEPYESITGLTYPTLKGRPIRPSFPVRGWQTDLRQEDVKRIYDRLSSTWSSHLPPATIAYQAQCASTYLQRYPEIVTGLVAGDENIWKAFIKRMKIRPMVERFRYTTDRSTMTHMVDLAWLAKPMLYSKKESILNRLSHHWNDAPRKLVNSRLAHYTENFGAITSPEPLLSNDHEAFVAAANAIFCETQPKSKRHVGASRHDILHQNQDSAGVEAGNQYVPRKLKYHRLNAGRFTSGQDWMKDKSPGEIAKIHDAIGSNIVDTVSTPTLHNIFIAANKYLEGHKDVIEKIEEGDQHAAWKVARLCVKRISQLRRPR